VKLTHIVTASLVGICSCRVLDWPSRLPGQAVYINQSSVKRAGSRNPARRRPVSLPRPNIDTGPRVIRTLIGFWAGAVAAIVID